MLFRSPVFSDINGMAEPVQSISVSGITSAKYGFHTPAPEIRLFMVDLTAIGLYTLFRERADLLRDLSADATPLIPSRRRQLVCEALAETRDVLRKAHIVEEFLRSLIPDRLPRHIEVVHEATRILQASRYQLSLDEVVEHIGMSGRNFRRVFGQIAGVTPKTFQRIGRFERVFDAVMTGRSPLLTDTALDEGYYDQAHFIRDFESFTGYSPRMLPKEHFYMYHILTEPGFGSAKGSSGP